MAAEGTARPSLMQALRQSAQDLKDVALELPGVVSDVKRLLQDDVRLGAAETRETSRQAAIAGGLVGAAGVLAVVALIFACLALMFALATTLDIWLAALITSTIVLATGGVIGWVGYSRMRKVTPAPKRMLRSLGEDLTWLKTPISSTRK